MNGKQGYIDRLEPEQFIAFKHRERMISAKVDSVEKFDEKVVAVNVVTKNGSRYKIDPAEISWVKTGSRWPSGIYNALKANNTFRKGGNSGESEKRLDGNEDKEASE